MNEPNSTPGTDLRERLRRQALRTLAATDVFAFGEYVFGYKPYAHHRQMVEFALRQIEAKQNGVILAPRGAAKSTWVNTILLTFLVATRPHIRIGLFSQKDKKAEAMSAAIMWVISESEPFKEVFGNLRGSTKWTATEWRRKGSKWSGEKDMTLVAGGVNNSSAVSKRFDIVVLDDALDAENTYTIDRREKVENWFFATMKPAQAAEGVSILVVGMRWVEGDLYERLVETNKWPSLVMSAITTDDDGNDVSYWPEVWPLSRLYGERDDVGWDNFAAGYQNDISGQRAGLIFKKEWFEHEGFYFDALPSDRRFIYTMGVDLAMSESERADFTARAVVAEDERHEHWILGVQRTKTETGQKDFVKTGAASYPGISKILIENNQGQATIVQDLLAETRLPIVGKRTDTDKRTRARAVAARYEAKRIHHHRSLRGGPYEAELLNFPKTHDDQIDAVGLAMDITGNTGSFAAAGSAPPKVVSSEALVREVRFVTGPAEVPAHIAILLTGIDTLRLTRDEAIALANRQAEAKFMRSALRGVLGR